MLDQPVLHRYQPTDREEVFDFIRAMFPADVSARIIAQWGWKYDANPFNPPDGPIIHLVRVGSKLVSQIATFRVPLWAAGTKCMAENRGDQVVHPDYRRQKLWQRVNLKQSVETPIALGWSGDISTRAAMVGGWVPGPVSKLWRVLDPGPFIERFTHSRLLGSLGAGAGAASWGAGAPLRRRRDRQVGARIRLDSFDESVDALWERARRADKAMLVRDHRYLNWRYCQRPDARYSLFGIKRNSELAGFLVARATTRDGIKWGYLVDFLTAEDSTDVLSALLDDALDEFRRLGVAAVSCFATDPASRRTLLRRGFFPFPQRDPSHFVRRIRRGRTDLQKFATLGEWYVTMGDGDYEMTF